MITPDRTPRPYHVLMALLDDYNSAFPLQPISYLANIDDDLGDQMEEAIQSGEALTFPPPPDGAKL